MNMRAVIRACRLSEEMGFTSTVEALEELQRIRAAASEQDPEDWCQYVAGAVAAYLFPGVDDEHTKPIAGIIRARLRALRLSPREQLPRDYIQSLEGQVARLTIERDALRAEVQNKADFAAHETRRADRATEERDGYWQQLQDERSTCDFYRRRVDLLQTWQQRMRDPERTIVCDIIANGQTLPDADGSRYGRPAPFADVARADDIQTLEEKVLRMTEERNAYWQHRYGVGLPRVQVDPRTGNVSIGAPTIAEVATAIGTEAPLVFCINGQDKTPLLGSLVRDSSVPPGEAWLKDPQGKLLGRITGLDDGGTKE